MELQTDIIGEEASECKPNKDDGGLANHMGECEELAPGMRHSATCYNKVSFLKNLSFIYLIHSKYCG